MENEKTHGIIAYLTFVGAIIAYFMNLDRKSEYVFFHIRQMLGLFVIYLVTQVIDIYIISQLNIDFNERIGLLIWLPAFVCWLIGFVGAVQYKQKEIPFLGKFFQKWFYTIR